jgi:hypothetical protein
MLEAQRWQRDARRAVLLCRVAAIACAGCVGLHVYLMIALGRWASSVSVIASAASGAVAWHSGAKLQRMMGAHRRDEP